jgi:hypothetical protein
MLIITSVYIAEAQDPTEREVYEDRSICVADLKELSREWVGIYEGKNRVLPMDEGQF